MTARIFAFPPSRRQDYIRRQARMIASMNAVSGERYLSRQIEQQRGIMIGRGIAPQTVQRELKALERAIRAAMWGAVLTPGGDGR
ncbi:DUF6074 family protein [Bradyrhizobium sp. LTSP849]|uniref:DUF6074 family protein n=1 Tax=Bradyrhizobium sp. LTSP849 TaxID=1615890 RepID=UPI0024BF21E5|nr:DUF6074 family protein [Bradyrhizobium sp. LTSP849]